MTQSSVSLKTKRSLPQHLTSGGHKASVSFHEQGKINHRIIAENRQQEPVPENLPSTSDLARARLPDTKPVPNEGISAAEREMWENYRPDEADFDAGMADIDDALAEKAVFEKSLEQFGLWNAEALGAELNAELHGEDQEQDVLEDEEELVLNEMLHNLDFIDELDDCDASSDEWYPYSSKTMFLLDMLDNLPRLRVSDSLMKVFIWILRESGARNVPSLHKLHQMQKELRNNSSSGIPTIPCTSDWNNPLVRQHIAVYPEIPADGVISEIWHAEKWRKHMDLDLLSPMFDAGDSQHFYVNEIAMLRHSILLVPRPCTTSFVIPIRWVIYQKAVHAESFLIYLDKDGCATVDTDNVYLVPAADLKADFLELQDRKLVPDWSDEAIHQGHPGKMPNPNRKIAAGAPFYTSFVDYFSDDVSGNRSKSWNKHWNVYMQHRNLPRKLLQQEFHTHFISTSQHVSVTEQFSSFKAVVEETHRDPIRVRDTATGDKACIRLGVNANPSDNPMQSETSSHIGDKGNFPCQKCDVGGPQAIKATDARYHSFFAPGKARDKETILKEVQKQVKVACNGIAQPIKERQTDTGVKDAFTQYWIEHILQQFKVMVDSEDGRTEADISKELCQWVDDHYDDIFSPFLTLKGLDPTKDTLVEILHTILLGILKRQLKTLLQTNVFHVHDLVDEKHFTAWKAVGELEINNMDIYCEDLRIAIANVLDAFAIIDPSKMVMKIKLHLLTHLPEDSRAFGPLISVATKIYEAFNADQEGLKHRATGGWWNTRATGLEPDWRQAGSGVRDFLQSQPTLQKLLGWTPAETWVPGSIKLLPAPRKVKGASVSPRPVVKLEDTLALGAVNIGQYDRTSLWLHGKHVTAKSGDLCPMVGLAQFQVGAIRHPVFGMPTLSQRHDEECSIIVPSAHILFIVNVQHDCRAAKCIASGMRAVIQERTATSRQEQFIEHQPLQQFIINTTALHNSHLLRRTLPRNLIQPIPLIPEDDRLSFHNEQAAILRTSRMNKAQARKDKAAEKKKKKLKLRELSEGPEADILNDDVEGTPTDTRQREVARKPTRTKKCRAALADSEEEDLEQGPSRKRSRLTATGNTGRALRPRNAKALQDLRDLAESASSEDEYDASE
ncbi:hypothetical protein C8J56DRAFT_893430 [Mycena floridula]|nr:hypothetical protein C8J56DRAFT_893430 [Mycena floridula]